MHPMSSIEAVLSDVLDWMALMKLITIMHLDGSNFSQPESAFGHRCTLGLESGLRVASGVATRNSQLACQAIKLPSSIGSIGWISDESELIASQLDDKSQASNRNCCTLSNFQLSKLAN